MLKYFFPVLIFFCAFGSFSLLPFANVGKFHIKDVGNFLIWLGFFHYFFSYLKKKYDLSILNNTFTWLIFAYILFVVMQVSLAAMFYDQSLLSGLIRTRDQLYYGSFLFFLLLIDTRENADRLMNLLTILSIILICLALINYFGPTIFHHTWMTEGSGMRSGIIRAFVPGVSIILFAGLWHLVRYLNDNKATIWSLLFFLLSYAAVIFRQTRGRIIALTITILLMLIIKKKYKLLVGLTFVVISVSTLFAIIIEQNIFSNQFGLAYKEFTEKSGNWGARVEQIKFAWEVIKQHPLTGSGGLVIRDVPNERATEEMRWLGAGADLGYINWIKYFGLPGILWMMFFIAIFFKKLWTLLQKTTTDRVMANFAGFMFTYILIAEVTLDSFYRPSGILLLCVTLAMLLNSRGVMEAT